MLTIQVAKGVDGSPVRFRIMAPDRNGGYSPAAGMLDGTEPLTCEVWPGSDRAVVATLPAELAGPDDDTPFDTNDPHALTQFPRASFDALDAGTYRARTQLADLSALLVEFAVELRDGPGASLARPAYHTYKQLCDECSFADRLSDHLHDETGFADVAADARDWIDAAILSAVPTRGVNRLRSYEWGWDWGPSDPARYAEALGSGSLELTTPDGMRIVRASVYRTLAVLYRRAVGMTNAPVDFIAEGGKYQARAEAELILATARFPGSDLSPIPLGSARRRLRY